MLSLNIRNLRQKLQMSQTQFAQKLGVTQGTVSQWENGRVQPEIDMLVFMACEFGISLDALLDVPGEKESTKKEKGIVISKLDALSRSIVRDILELPFEKKQRVRAYLDGMKEK
ncbi:MAG: helix-turn-helix transcriptional regulator [Clostridiales bacterium]|nr:helix-turn-helix transcriptional regulator [Clostridiales bacterium]